MQINQKTLKLLLSMNDAQLAGVIAGLAADAGIDAASLSLDAERLASIRAALGSVSDADLEALKRLYGDFRAQQGGDRNV